MSQNPYQQPQFSSPYQGGFQQPPGGGSGGGGNKAKAPAIALLILTAISVIFYLLSGAYDIYVLTSGELDGLRANPNAPFDVRTILIIRLVAIVFVMIAHMLIVAGAVQMLKLGSFKLAMTAGVLSVIPCFATPCVILGIPFGIWALVVLNDPNVKRSFSS